MYQFQLKWLFFATTCAALTLGFGRLVGFWKVATPIYGMTVLFAAACSLRALAFAPGRTMKRVLCVTCAQIAWFLGAGAGSELSLGIYYPIFAMYMATWPEPKGGYHYGDLPFFLFGLPAIGFVTYTILSVGQWGLWAGDARLRESLAAVPTSGAPRP